MFARGKYGIEYTPPKPDPEVPLLRRVLVVAALAAAAVAVVATVNRIRHRPADDAGPETASPVVQSGSPTPPVVIDVPADPIAAGDNRSVRVQNLLRRLEEAERRQDVEMQVTTIEQLRATPGVADLDDKLARRLGTLNLLRLFRMRSAQWTVEVTVKNGDAASRIAYEHGSTFASLAKLNDGVDLNRLRAGAVLRVMNHPRFSLVVSRRARTADLSLNGKFFKRYDLTGEVRGEVGAYVLPERFRSFCTDHGVPFKPLDRAELEMLLPRGTQAYIKDI